MEYKKEQPKLAIQSKCVIGYVFSNVIYESTTLRQTCTTLLYMEIDFNLIYSSIPIRAFVMSGSLKVIMLVCKLNPKVLVNI